MELKTEYLILIGTLGGAVIGAITSLVTVWITKVYEDKSRRRELLITSGLEQWKKAIDGAHVRGGMVVPLEDYIIHLLALSDLMVTKMSPTETVDQLKKVQETTDAILAWRTEKDRSAQGRRNA